MNIYRKLRLDPAPTGGGGGGTGAPPTGTPPPSFRDSLPAEIRAEKVFDTVPDLGTLAKGYLHAQKMIGSKRLPIPEPTWGETEWNDFYAQTGRPNAATEYKVPEYKFAEGMPALDQNRIKSAAESLHKLGLSQKQFEGVMSQFFKNANEDFTSYNTNRQNMLTSAQQKLRESWGAQYDNNVGLAKAVIAKFGGQPLVEYLNANPSIGNDPQIVQLLAKVGQSMMESPNHGSGDEPLLVTDAHKAQAEIKKLTNDKEFMGALRDKNHVGHKNAVERWTNLHYTVAGNAKVS